LYVILFIGICSLVRDVFGKDNEGKVPMEKVIMLIWVFRDDPTVVKFMAQFVAKVSKTHFSFNHTLTIVSKCAHSNAMLA